MGICYWCRTQEKHDYPCCVTSWLFQIHVHEAAHQILSRPDTDVIGFGLDKPRFSPPDNVEE